MLPALLLLCCCPQVPGVADLAPDYFELDWGMFESGADNGRGSDREGQRIGFRLGWLLGATPPAEEERAAWRALRDANLQRDRMAEQLRATEQHLAQVASTLHAMDQRDAARDLLAAAQREREPIPARERPPPEGEDDPLGDQVVAAGAALTILAAFLRGQQGLALMRHWFSTSPPPS